MRNVLDRLNKYLITLIFIFLVAGCGSPEAEIKIIPYPAGYSFAFTITDDPDEGWFEQKKVVYDYLDSIGMKISIGVWVFDNTRGSGEIPYYHQGISLEDERFLKYIISLKNKGFGLFLHTVSGGNNTREETIKGFELYREYFGEYPNHWINHWTNYEDIYWGDKRFSNPALRLAYTFFLSKETFQGDNPDSEYFWGDYSQKYIKYVRGWASEDLNTLKVNPSMPYHDSEKPYVRYWYANSDGKDYEQFNQLISRSNVDRLIEEKGTAIVYTHFANRFNENRFLDEEGKLKDSTKQLLSYITSHDDGWFVPVTTILDRFIAIRQIKIVHEKDRYIVINTGPSVLKDLALEIHDISGVIYQNKVFKSENGVHGILNIDIVEPLKAVILRKTGTELYPRKVLQAKEKIQLIWNWIKSR